MRATDVELSAAKGRLQQVLNVLGLERDFRRLSQSVGQVSMHDKIRTCMHYVRMCVRAYLLWTLRDEALVHAFIFSLLFSCLLPDLSRLFTSASL